MYTILLKNSVTNYMTKAKYIMVDTVLDVKTCLIFNHNNSITILMTERKSFIIFI